MSILNKLPFGKRKNGAPNNKDSPGLDPNTIEIPDETAPRRKRYDSAGYLLLHPELRKDAAMWTILYGILFILFVLTVPGCFFAEFQTFIHLFNLYGFLR